MSDPSKAEVKEGIVLPLPILKVRDIHHDDFAGECGYQDFAAGHACREVARYVVVWELVDGPARQLLCPAHTSKARFTGHCLGYLRPA